MAKRDGDDHLTPAYQQMVKWLMAQNEQARGAQSWAAKRLGISPQHLSNIMNGSKVVGDDLVERATRNLNLDPDYFALARMGRPKEELALFLRRVELPSGSLAELEQAAKEVLTELIGEQLTRERAVRFVMSVRRSDFVESAIVHADAVEAGASAAGHAGALASKVLSELGALRRSVVEK